MKLRFHSSSDQPLDRWDGETIECVDLGQFPGTVERKVEEFTRWRNQLHPHNGRALAPVPVLVLMPEGELGSHADSALARVGAVACPYPPGYESAFGATEKEALLKQALIGMSASQAISSTSPALFECPPTPDPDPLAIYANPPYRLTEQGFADLVQRMNSEDAD